MTEILLGNGKRVGVEIQLSLLSDGAEGVSGIAITIELPADSRKREMESTGNGRRHQLELLGSLAGGIAHDLNNILTGVLGHISFLRLSHPVGGSFGDSLSAVEDGGRRAAAMMQQFLEIARGEASKQRPVNLSLVIAASVNLLRAALPKNISLEVEGDKEDIFVWGDEGQLNQVVMNLALNARDALPNGGRTKISLLRVLRKDCVGCPSFAAHIDEFAVLRIGDNGLGMSKEVQGRIFEPFFTTKYKDDKSGGGTGLGLANVSAIVRAHGGWVEVESQLGVGSEFLLYLPLHTGEDSPFESVLGDELSPVEIAPRGTERILVVDDEDIVRAVIQKSLEHLGYAVDVVENGVEALKVFREDPFRYDLVILDMMMPHMSGDETFHELQKCRAGVGVLIASGYSSDGRAKAVLDSGGLGFIQKPFSVEDLAKEVRRCLDCSKTVSESGQS